MIILIKKPGLLFLSEKVGQAAEENTVLPCYVTDFPNVHYYEILNTPEASSIDS